MIKRVGKNLSVLTAEVPAAKRAARARRLHGAPRRAEPTTRSTRSVPRSTMRSSATRPSAAARTRTSSATRCSTAARSSQAAVGHDRILEVIEPLLGDDCHVIANTAWRNFARLRRRAVALRRRPARAATRRRRVGRPHPVSGVRDRRTPHVEGLPGVLRADRGGAGQPSLRSPRAVRHGSPIPTSPTTAGRRCCSKRTPATSRCSCPTCGIAARRPTAATAGCSCRRTTAGATSRSASARPTEVNHLSPEAIERAQTQRERDLVGLHHPYFYDG